MIQNLPQFIIIAFILTSLLTLFIFYLILKSSISLKVNQNRKYIILVLIVWMIFQGILAYKNVYINYPKAMPPSIVLFGIFPIILIILFFFITPVGKRFISSLSLKNITYLNVVRIPVEVVLYWLFLNKTIPELMTFKGNNFDIIAGITAPFISYFGFKNIKISTKFILIWNFLSLILLINIVVSALLSAPSPIQKLSFDQPNIAILYFPFVWLPTFIVPLVLFGHLVSIKRLLFNK